MELQGKVSILFDHDGLTIEIHDNDAVIQFCSVRLDREQACQALSRLSNTPCVFTVMGLEHVGKKRERNTLEFPMPKDEKNVFIAKEVAKKVCPEGWAADCYFGSQDSFFFKGEERWARCGIVRWVDK